MPIVAWWPNLIIIFELTMLGAILATVVTLFVTALLPSAGGSSTIRKSPTARSWSAWRNPRDGRAAVGDGAQ